MNVLAFARALPKVELHCHLEGAARPSTIAELARANGVTLPTDDPFELFQFQDLDSFLAVYAVISGSLVTADDFRRITYEALEDAVAAHVRYREMFFSPGFVIALGVPVTVNSDDPGMMGTTICDDYEAVADRFDYDATTMEDIAFDAIDASWAPVDEQAALRARFRAEMDDLRVQHGLAPR